MTRISNSPAETQGIIFARVLGGIIAWQSGQMVLFYWASIMSRSAMIVILQNINHHHVFLTQHPWKEQYSE